MGLFHNKLYAMPSLLTVPNEAQLKILCELDVLDILRVERTCKHLRDIIATRHLWIIKLDDLSQTCAPVLPPYVDVTELTDEQLREIVIRAFRTYWQMMDGSSSTISYALVKTIVPSRPEDISDGRPYHITRIQLSPCRRFLFMLYWAYERRGIRIHDLLNGDRCIWSKGFDTPEWEPLERSPHDMVFDFNVCGDCSLTVLLNFKLFGFSSKSITRLVHLVPDESSGHIFRKTSSMKLERTDDYDRADVSCAVSGRFAVVGISLPPKFIVMDWIENRVVVIKNALTDWPISIWHDFAFYGDLDEEGSNLPNLQALSLTQAFDIATSSSSNIIHIRNLDVSRFEPTIPGCSTTMFSNLRYVLYKYPWRDDLPYLTVLMVTKSPSSDNPGPFFAAIRAIFDASRPPGDRWSQISSSHPSQYISEKNVVGTGMHIRTYLSLSGRALLSGRLESPGGTVVEEEDATLVVNRRGELLFPELSRNLATEALMGSNERGYLQDFTEIHTGIVIKSLYGEFKRHHIELYAPISD